MLAASWLFQKKQYFGHGFNILGEQVLLDITC